MDSAESFGEIMFTDFDPRRDVFETIGVWHRSELARRLAKIPRDGDELGLVIPSPMKFGLLRLRFRLRKEPSAGRSIRGTDNVATSVSNESFISLKFDLGMNSKSQF